jgi:hypothetical protein
MSPAVDARGRQRILFRSDRPYCPDATTGDMIRALKHAPRRA